MAQKTAQGGLTTAAAKVYGRKWSFLAAFLIVFYTSFGTLVTLDIVPEAKTETKKEPTVELTASVSESLKRTPEAPVRMVIPAIDMDVKIANPVKTDVASLDAELMKGAVRYPTSAKLGEEGNVILFGHSSYLPVVNNQAFKIFNEIQNLKKGDRITVYGDDGAAYVYEVETVSQEDATSAAIPLEVGKPTLTLSTCDSFGKKTDRFVVIATLVGSQAAGT